MHRQVGQRSVVEGWLPETVGRNRRLEAIDAVVDWAPFERALSGLHRSRTGRPSYPPLTMFKALLLETWYDIADTELEEALADRLSFRRFVGLGLADPTPDHSTVSRFRTQLAETGLSAELMATLERQLEARGLFVKQGTMLDASLVTAQVKRPPRSAGPGAASATDPDAAWTGLGGGKRSGFGYQAHIGVDQGSGLIRRAELHPANIYESLVADDLICGDERAVYADKAYEKRERRERLRAAGVKDRIKHRANRYHPLTPWQQRRNELIEPRRRQVERIFGTLKRSYGYTRVRYRGLARNRVELHCKVIAYNLRRALSLQRAAA